MKTYDYAIVGAGVSGLTLAWLLEGSALRDRSILLVDGVEDDDTLRTLSFWSASPMAFDPLVAHRWRELRFHDGRSARTLALEAHEYRTLFFADLQRETKRRLGAHAKHRVVDGRLQSLTEDARGVTLVVGEETFRARFVFDSRFRRSELVPDASTPSLEQHFHGWIVRAARDVFEPAVATWLDFRGGEPAGTAFVYVLPFSKREALVELVTLEPAVAPPLLRAYLGRAYALDDVEIVAEEAGVSPMTTRRFPWRVGQRVRRIGVAAGRLKPSTGYALTRIVEDGSRIVAALERGLTPVVPPSVAPLYRILDALLLEVWSATPAEIPRIFRALLERNPVDRVLRFLDERATPIEIARLGWALPKWPFVRAALRLIGRHLAAP